MAATTFIYALKELKPGEYFSTKIRYIGKANDPYKRFDRHYNTKENNHRGCWIRGLLIKNLSIQLEILDEVPESEWPFWEREYIRLFRAIGFDLVNGTDGGTTRHLAPEKKQSLSHIEKRVTQYRGRHHSPEAREKISITQRGKCLSPKTREKIGAAMRRWHEQKKKAQN